MGIHDDDVKPSSQPACIDNMGAMVSVPARLGNSGADDMWCQANDRVDHETATFNNHMYHGRNPNKDPSGLYSDEQREAAGW